MQKSFNFDDGYVFKQKDLVKKKRNSVTFSRCKYVEAPVKNLFLHVLKGWLIDIIWKGQFIDWLDKDDFKEIINMAGLTEQSVDKVINYLSDKPYKPRTFDMVFNRLVQINYIDNYYR